MVISLWSRQKLRTQHYTSSDYWPTVGVTAIFGALAVQVIVPWLNQTLYWSKYPICPAKVPLLMTYWFPLIASCASSYQTKS